jgi:sec-independent protein translocase protein TatA
MPGLPELLVILLIVLVVFGANKLPSIGDALGRSIRNFKRAQGGAEEVDEGDEEKPVRKKLSAKKPQPALEPAPATDADEEEEEEEEDDDEWEEVVVRRRKKKPGAARSAS